MSDTDLIVMARKPLSEKNIAHNVLRWGTGGINIDECRIGTEKIEINGTGKKWRKNGSEIDYVKEPTGIINEGRFPANLILDEEAGKILDEQSGTTSGTARKQKFKNLGNGEYGKKDGRKTMPTANEIEGTWYGDTGGASRFFYNTDNELKQTTNRSEKMNYTIYNEDCLIQLKELEDNSIDSIVTDPPYHLTSITKRFGKDTSAPAQYGTDGVFQRSSKGFMGKEWDGGDIAFRTEVWEECLRVLKPGGHILAFGGTRTYHRMTVAIEDAGFEIRDCIFWCYGSGFPKSHNIGKAVDKLQGNKREVVETKEQTGAKFKEWSNDPNETRWHNQGFNKIDGKYFDITKGNSPYEGWGTALKPAVEPVVMGRKPFKGSVAQNVLEHGTGGINIDGCRIEYQSEDDLDKAIEKRKSFTNTGNGHQTEYVGGELKNPIDTTQSINSQGRFPANLILDEEAGKLLDEQSGTVRMASNVNDIEHHSKMNFTPGEEGKVKMKQVNVPEIKGGASRFFYCPKTSKKERNEGCDELEAKETRITNMSGLGTETTIQKRKNDDGSFDAPKSKNNHPTVKPCSLLQYLIRLITPKGGTVLDPFMGSGSTGKAAMKEGMDFIGIEKEEEYFEIAKARIEWEKNQNNHTKFFDV